MDELVKGEEDVKLFKMLFRTEKYRENYDMSQHRVHSAKYEDLVCEVTMKQYAIKVNLSVNDWIYVTEDNGNC